MVNSVNDNESDGPGDNRSNRPVYQGDTTLSLPEAPVALLAPGTILLEKFRIIELLGQGGMGSVYRVEHLLMNRQFALKCLNKYQAADAGWKRFQNEAKAAHMLDHANLLKVYEFGLLPGGQPFFLMELVEGVTLADEIKRLGHLPVERAIKIFIQVAFAIGYAHENRVIHRDLKPSNIMLVGKKSETDAEVVKVVDFGIAKLTGVDEFNQQTLTKTGEIFGSPLYMSPEQCTGVGVDHRSDLYSLGCVLYEALTSAPPFLGESALSTMMKHQSENQISLKEASLGMLFPPGLEHVVAKLLEKDPQHRYQSAGQLASDLIHVERSLNEADEQSQTASRSESAAKLLRADALASKQAAKSGSNTPRYATVSTIAAVTFFLGFGASLLLLQPDKHHEASVAKASIQPAVPPSDPQSEKSIASSKDWSTIQGGERLFQFPAASSLGKIVMADGESHDAKGTFAVPKDVPLGIVANDNLIRHPQYMDKFKPGELVVFDFNTSKATSPAFFAKIGAMTGLKALNMYDVEFMDKDAPELSKLKKLVYLNLGFTGISGASILKYAPLNSLNSLDLTCVKDGKLLIEKLPQLPRLHHVLFVSCKLKDKDVEQIAKSDHIKVLDLAWNDITDTGVAYLSKLKNLEYLDLSETDVSPMVWKSLVQMPGLRKVKIAKIKSTPWLPENKKFFETQMAQHAPGVEINWDYENNLDFIAAKTDMTWLGLGMKAHKCPIMAAFTEDEGVLGPPPESVHH